MNRDDSKLTPVYEVQPGATTLDLSVLSSPFQGERLVKFPGFTLEEGSLKNSIGTERVCSIPRGTRYHECEHHAVFLKWS